MTKPKVGLLTFSDGREPIHKMLKQMNLEYQRKMKRALEETGLFRIVAGREIVWHPSVAKEESMRLKEEGVLATIFNFAVWSFPHLPAIASEFAPGPYLLFSNINPPYPGMVGMLASAGALDQTGRFHKRVSGDIKLYIKM